MNSRYVSPIVFSLLLYIGFPSAVPAADEPSPPPIMDTVVVTATKTDETRSEIPNSVVVKDQSDLENNPGMGLGQLLGSEPGIDWRSRGDYGGATQLFSIRGMQADEAVVLINGLSINSPSLGQADVGGVSLNSIERVEVVKGSGSLLYGSGAQAGIVNLIPKRPSGDGLDLSLSAGYGTQNTSRFSAEVGQYLWKNLGVYATVNRIDTDGHRDNGDATQYDGSVNLVYSGGDAIDVSAYIQHADRDSGNPGIRPPEGTGTGVVNGSPFYNAESASLRDRTREENTRGVIEAKTRPVDWGELRLSGEYTDLRSTNETRNNATTFFSTAGEGIRTQVDNKVLGAEGSLTLDPVDEFRLLVGADHDDHSWDNRSANIDFNGSEQSGATTNTAHLYQTGSFFEAQYQPAQYVKLLYGHRHQRHSTFGHEDLPRYGAVVKPFETTTIKATRGRHFKAPTPNDLFWPSTNFSTGNANLQPQIGWHTDVTAEQSLFGGRIFATAGYFEWNIDKKIVWAPNANFPGPFGDKWAPTNLNRSTGRGFEGSITARPTKNWTATTAYTYTDATESTPTVERRASYVPRHMWKLSTTYAMPLGLTATGVVRYVSERYFYRSASVNEPDDELSAYATVDARLQYFLGDHWRLSLDGTNLLDADYDTYVGSFTDTTGTRVWGRFPGAGRAVFLSVGYDY